MIAYRITFQKVKDLILKNIILKLDHQLET